MSGAAREAYIRDIIQRRRSSLTIPSSPQAVSPTQKVESNFIQAPKPSTPEPINPDTSVLSSLTSLEYSPSGGDVRRDSMRSNASIQQHSHQWRVLQDSKRPATPASEPRPSITRFMSPPISSRWQDPINSSGISINIDKPVEPDFIPHPPGLAIFTSGKVFHPDSEPVPPSSTTKEITRSNLRLFPFNMSLRPTESQDHRSGSIDENWMTESLTDVIPEDATPLEKSRAISAYLMQNTPASTVLLEKPLEPLRFRKNDSSKSKYSMYNMTMKPILHRFLGASISHTSELLAWWSFGIDLVHIALLILIPVQLAWTNYFTSVYWLYIYFFMDLVMMFDCWIQAKVDFNDQYGCLVEDTEVIMRRYLFTGNGLLQVIVSFPWEAMMFAVHDVGLWEQLLGPSEGAVPLTFVRRKLWAMILFGKIFLRAPLLEIYKLPIPSLAMPIARLVKCMFILMLIGHVDACLFWFIDWTLAPGPDRWIEKNNLMAVSISTQYLVSYLSALRSLVLKLRECSRDAENIYVIFEFIAGILSYGTVFGNIHSILELMDSTAAVNQAEEYHNFEMEGIITFMKEKKIKPELQQMVRDYKELQWLKSKGLDEDHFFVGIPKSVQQEIKNFLYLDLVQTVPIFQNTDINFQYILAFKIRPLHVLDGWTIFRKGDEGEEMFFIKSGRVEICSEDGKIVFATLTDGAFFGEIALFESCRRTATASAKGNCELCTLSKEEFNMLMNLYPEVAEGIRETIRQRKIQEEEKKKNAAILSEILKPPSIRSGRSVSRKPSFFVGAGLKESFAGPKKSTGNLDFDGIMGTGKTKTLEAPKITPKPLGEALSAAVQQLVGEAHAAMQKRIVLRRDAESAEFSAEKMAQALSSELDMLRRNESSLMRTEIETISRNLESLARKTADKHTTLKAEVSMDLSNHKAERRALGTRIDLRVQEIHHKLTIELSGIKTRLESLKMEATQRAIWVAIIAFGAVLISSQEI
ncbi:hypothetical protein HDU98_000931 [Podochytrium sp. JEL0797]|nr:hypothetical protein HDU98_000931 [Podochytrium sp. JEL0797]